MNRIAKKPISFRILFVLLVFLLVAAILIRQLVILQLIDYKKYQDRAFQQYTTELTISPKRGTIYDRNMKALAVSATVENINISPYEIDADKEDLIATKLAEILGLDAADIKKKMSNKKSKYQAIQKQVERETADKIRQFIKDEKITGIHFEETTKRYYPDSHLASHIIGFTNYDNKGIYGVESFYENYLKGTPGKIVTAQNGKGKDMPFKYESYIGAKNGTNVVLTIDWSVQYFLEKALETALKDTQARNRVLGIVYDVKTGEILAMSTKPDYDLNQPYVLDEASQAKLDAATGTEEEKNTLRKQLLEMLWKNKVITEPYEPGSTFKIVTSAMALEEKKVTLNDTFTCTGSMTVGGRVIHCHQRRGHGTETFVEGLQNSCNPVFMTLAARIGKTLFYKYFESFGCMAKTGIDLPGEVSSIYHTDINDFNEVELAVYAFGQTFKITPLQLIAAQSSVANGGKLMRPHIVKSLVDDDGNVIKNFEPEVVRQIVSPEVGKTIMQILADGISRGSTKNAYVKGYSIAAKTGTSQKRDTLNPETGQKDLYIGSCVAFAPANDPQIACIVAIDEPRGEYYGGTIAAPVVAQVMSDTLPYLNVEPSLTEAELATMDVPVQDYRGMSLTDAKAALAEKGFTYKVIGNGEVVNEQLPRFGSSIKNGGIVILYTGNEVPTKSVTVPDVKGYSATEVNRILTNLGLNVQIEGSYREDVSGAVALKQAPAAGEKVQPGTVITVEFRHLEGLLD